MDRITALEYWAEVDSIAKSVAEECKEYGSDRGDMLRETVDGHRWVIYTYYHNQVLEHSDNDCAMFDDGLVPEKIDSWADVTGPGAYCALYADVAAKLADIEEEDS